MHDARPRGVYIAHGQEAAIYLVGVQHLHLHQPTYPLTRPSQVAEILEVWLKLPDVILERLDGLRLRRLLRQYCHAIGVAHSVCEAARMRSRKDPSLPLDMPGEHLDLLEGTRGNTYVWCPLGSSSYPIPNPLFPRRHSRRFSPYSY